jgi:ureidoacrylate peracid hydrolase
VLSPEERLDPKQTALIVVDVQNDFCHPDGGCARSFGVQVVKDIQAAMPVLRRLIEGARAAGVFTVFIRSIYDDEYLSPAWRDQKERRGAGDLCQSGSWGAEFYEGIAPEAQWGEIVVVKHRFDAFRGTELDSELRSRGVRRVVCCGFTTSICVESTARDAFFHDYYTTIAADAVAEFDRELHESTLRVFNRSFGPVLTVDEILAVWQRATRTASAATGAAAGG